MSISIIIPVYKNKELLQKSFSHNFPFIKDCEIIVVNDYPEESIEDIFANNPSVTLLNNEKNLGFAQTVNRGVREARGELLFLLNSDVFLKDDSFKKVKKLFEENKNLFAVGLAQVEKDGSIVGKNEIYFEGGLFKHRKTKNLEFGKTGWAEGGTGIFRKSFYDKLGGMSSLYSPFYWEDVDLSYRASKLGWDVLFDPSVEVEHHHASTIGKYFNGEVREIISYRNQFIFTRRNATLWQLVLHSLHLPFILVKSFLTGNTKLIKGFFRSL